MYISPKMNFYFYEIVNHHTKTKQNKTTTTTTMVETHTPIEYHGIHWIFSKLIEKKRIDRNMKSTLHIYLISCYYF